MSVLAIVGMALALILIGVSCYANAKG